MSCDHKFVGSSTCAKCGWAPPPRVLDTELGRLRTILADAVDLLRDWEDYEPGDPQCTWATRRAEFLKEHEAEGR